MKSTVFLLFSEALLILSVFLIASGMHGNVGFNAGWPVSQFSIRIFGEATGGKVAVAFLFLILAAANLVIGVVRFAQEKP